MVIHRGSVQSCGLPYETGISLHRQLIVTSSTRTNNPSELLTQFSYPHPSVSLCQISSSTYFSPTNCQKMVADTVPQFCNNFNVPPVKEIKLEPQEYVEWRNTFNVRQTNITSLTGTLCIPGTNSSTSWRGRFGPERGISGPVSASRSLDLLRQNLQNIVNQEIDHVFSRYLEKYFHPAIENIKDNLGPESVTQDMLRKVCRQFLEDAKMMYSSPSSLYCSPESQNSWKSAHVKSERNRSHKSNTSKIVKNETIGINQIIVTEESTLKVGVLNSQNGNSSKRKSQVYKYNNTEHECSKKRQKCGVTSSSKVTATVASKMSSTSSAEIIHNSMCNQGSDQQQSRPHSSTVTSPTAPSNNTPAVCSALSKMKSKDIGSSAPNPKWDSTKWEASRIVSQTLFVMGARANKALGFGQMRGRLYMKHPELFKYSGDQEDKEWLTRNNLMAPTGGKAYLMIVEDIRELAETEEYKNNPNLLLDEIHGFEAPDFMLKKIRCYVNNLRMSGSNPSHSSNPGKNTHTVKAKVHNKLPKILIPPVLGPVGHSENIQPLTDERKALQTKVNETKMRDISHTVKSILETKLREDKSSLISETLAPSSCKSSSTSNTSSSISSSLPDNKITLKSLLESKTSYHIGEKRLSDK